VDALVGRINGRFGTAQWTPVRYLYRGFSQEELLAVYRRADVMLVTPVRDGMNLVAKEFVASRMDGEGVLVLSEFTGAAAELAEAVIVNPYDIESAAEAYYRALTMPARERRARMLALRARVRSNPISRWADDFLKALRAAPHVPSAGEPVSTAEAVQAAVERCRTASSVLLLLDYDGTLVPFAPSPELAVPDEELLDLLARLAGRPRTRVHLVSGRKREALEVWFGGIGIGLHAEHGSWSRAPASERWERHDAVRPVPYDELLALLKTSTARTPGSLIERKSTGLSWHYRLAPPELGRRQAEAIVEEVERRFARDSVDVLWGDKVVEFRPAGVHKGLIVTRLTGEAPSGSLVVTLGDDATDEDMFAALPEGGMSVHVGPNPSGAGLRLRDFRAAREFLAEVLGSGRSKA
jgi:trehalose 6-phosphate synthase/phosphatase